MFFGAYLASERIRRASRIVTAPLPLSSAPGPLAVLDPPVLSKWAPTITRLLLVPGIRAMTLGWLKECVNWVTTIAGLEDAIDLTCVNIHVAAWVP